MNFCSFFKIITISRKLIININPHDQVLLTLPDFSSVIISILRFVNHAPIGGFVDIHKHFFYNWKIFQKKNNYMAIFYDFPSYSLEQLVDELNKIEGNKKTHRISQTGK